MKITPIEELFTLSDEYHARLEEGIPKDDAEACIGRITEVENIMVKSGKYLAEAKYHQDIQQSKLKEIIDGLGADVSASTLNNFIKSKTVQENYLVNYLERINRSSTHLLENLRTCVSYRKEEMKNLNYNPK